MPALLFSPAAAQGFGDPEITATISQRFELDSNLDLEDPNPGTSGFSDSRLTVGLVEETPVQRFSLGFNTGIRALWKAEEDFEFTFASPSTANAAYRRDWASGSIDTGASYRQRRVDFARDVFDIVEPVPGDDPIVDDPAQQEGTTIERRYDARLALALATDAPSSYGLTFSATRIDFSETEADLVARTTLNGGATWNLQLTPVLSSVLAARYLHYEADNAAGTEIRQAEADAGLAFEPSEILRLTAGIGYSDRERRDFGAVTEDDAGLLLRSTLRYDFEEIVVNASLRASAAAPTTRVSGDVSLAYPLVRGQVNARIFQSFVGATTGDEIRVTGAGIGLLRELDPVSRINFDIAASRRENQNDPGDADVDRIDFTTTLSRDFTEALSADVGYRFRNRDAGSAAATSHAVFVQVGRSFVTRP